MTSPNIKNLRSGFTLIETIIYVALLLIIIGGSLMAANEIMRGGADMSKKVLTYDEASFLMSKIDWALSGISSVDLPVPNTAGAKLSVNKKGYSQNPIVIDLDGTDLRIQEGGEPVVILNNSRVKISSLSFYFEKTAVPFAAASVKASFYADGKYFETSRLLNNK